MIRIPWWIRFLCSCFFFRRQYVHVRISLPSPPESLADVQRCMPEYIRSFVIDDETRDVFRAYRASLYVASVYLELIYKRMMLVLAAQMANLTITDELENAYKRMSLTCTHALSHMPRRVYIVEAYRAVLAFYKLFLMSLTNPPLQWLGRVHIVSRLQNSMTDNTVDVTGEKMLSLTSEF